MSSLFLSPNRDITTFLVSTQHTSFFWQKYFPSQLLPVHLHPFHHDFPKLLLLTELPRLGAQTRWAPHSVNGERPGPSGSALVTWVTLQGFLFLLTAEGAESQQDASLSAWGEIEPYHCMDRTGHFRPSHPTEQHLNNSQEFNCSKKAAEMRTHETGSKQGKTAIAPCWNLCFSSYTYVRNLKTWKAEVPQRQSQFMNLQWILLALNSLPWDSNLSLVFICTARVVIWLFSCLMAPCIAIHCSLTIIQEVLEQNFTRTAKQRRHLRVPTWHSRFKGFLQPRLGPSQMGGVFWLISLGFLQSPKTKTSPPAIK